MAPKKYNARLVAGLITAVRDNDVKFINMCFGAGASKDIPTCKRTEFKDKYCHNVFKGLKRDGFLVKEVNSTLICYAIQRDNVEVLELLCKDRDVDVNYMEQYQTYTPAKYAVDKGKLECLKVLVSHGADVYSNHPAADPNEDILRIAIAGLHQDIVEYLVMTIGYPVNYHRHVEPMFDLRTFQDESYDKWFKTALMITKVNEMKKENPYIPVTTLGWDPDPVVFDLLRRLVKQEEKMCEMQRDINDWKSIPFNITEAICGLAGAQCKTMV